MKSSSIKKGKPLWLRILIGLGVSIAIIIVTTLALEIWFFGYTRTYVSPNHAGWRWDLMRGISGMYEFNAELFRSLPSDEQMIENFHKHRGRL